MNHRQPIDFSRPYTGNKKCDRCHNLATRNVYGPDGDVLGFMCRECAEMWNLCINMAFDKVAAELAAEAVAARRGGCRQV